MSLKNAAAVCLISLFSATLVVLIARALDLQATSHIEPQLESLVEELRAIRRQGGLPPPAAIAGAPTTAGTDAAASDGLVVYFFHGDARCENCQAIESQSRQLVDSEFAAELQRGAIVWKDLNYDRPPGRELAKRFGVDKAVIVLAKTRDGQPLEGWKRLDALWGLVGDPTAFAALVRANIRSMLVAGPSSAGGTPPVVAAPAAAGQSANAPAKPAATSAAKPSEDLPVP